MYIGSLEPVSNKAGWDFAREVIDDETEEPIDLSDCEIVFEIRDGECGRAVLSATSSNGKITVDNGIFQVSFSASDMRSLSPKQYQVGCTIKNGDEEPAQFIIGTLPVLDGVVS